MRLIVHRKAHTSRIKKSAHVSEIAAEAEEEPPSSAAACAAALPGPTPKSFRLRPLIKSVPNYPVSHRRKFICLRSEYLAAGYTEEQAAEFDRDDTIAALEKTLGDLGHRVERIGHARSLIQRLAAGDRWELVFNIAEGFHGIVLDAWRVLGCRKSLEKARRRIRQFNPQFLLVALGLDTAKGDPTGTWQLRAKDFEINGRLIGGMGLPTLGINARAFFNGLAAAGFRAAGSNAPADEQLHGVDWRFQVQPEDPERIGRLAERTGFFHPEEIHVAVELTQERLARGGGLGISFHHGRTIRPTGRLHLLWPHPLHPEQLRSLLDRRTPRISAQRPRPPADPGERNADPQGRRQPDLRGYLPARSICFHPRLLRRLRIPPGDRPERLLRSR
jgi:hypothetical protein